MSRELEIVEALFAELMRADCKFFPRPREKMDAPSSQGVYIIYSPQGAVLHVGRTPRAAGGIRQRLYNHIHALSSFTNLYLQGHGAKLREGYSFQYLVVENVRFRALLEAYAVGHLCPAHIGLGEKNPPP